MLLIPLNASSPFVFLFTSKCGNMSAGVALDDTAASICGSSRSDSSERTGCCNLSAAASHRRRLWNIQWRCRRAGLIRIWYAPAGISKRGLRHLPHQDPYPSPLWACVCALRDYEPPVLVRTSTTGISRPPTDRGERRVKHSAFPGQPAFPAEWRSIKVRRHHARRQGDLQWFPLNV